MRFRALALLLLTVTACKKAKSDAPATQQKVDPARGVLLGIRPEKWVCENVATVADLTQILGGQPQVIAASGEPGPGLAAPCQYAVTSSAPVAPDAGAPGLDYWTFDVDCRPGHEERAETEITQWAQVGQQRIDEYKRKIAEGGKDSKKPPADDAGVPFAAPEGSREVPVGRRGLDVLGQGLIFVDDDAPCNVRVVGPDADRRLALATLIAKNLSEANAPMTPHQPRATQ